MLELVFKVVQNIITSNKPSLKENYDPNFNKHALQTQTRSLKKPTQATEDEEQRCNGTPQTLQKSASLEPVRKPQPSEEWVTSSLVDMTRPPGVVTSLTEVEQVPEANCRMLSQTTLGSSHSRLNSDVDDSDCTAIEGWGSSKDKYGKVRRAASSEHDKRASSAATSVSVFEPADTTKVESLRSVNAPSSSSSLENYKQQQHWTPSGVLIHNSRSPGVATQPRFGGFLSPWQPPSHVPPTPSGPPSSSIAVASLAAPPPNGTNCNSPLLYMLFSHPYL